MESNCRPPTALSFILPSSLKKIKCDFVIPKKLKNNEFIIAIEEDSTIKSFIYFSLYDEYIQINYSYTTLQYRRNGLSTILRNYLINYAKQINKHRIVSVPFETANSISILKKLGFTKQENNDSYILNL
jgi:hypothetical protein